MKWFFTLFVAPPKTTSWEEEWTIAWSKLQAKRVKYESECKKKKI
jgi:hypothetical protein